MPDDFEVSRSELDHICLRAGQWRGKSGKTRELEIRPSTYILSDYKDKEEGKNEEGTVVHERSVNEAVKHYIIYECNPVTQRRKVYRHFLLLRSGALVEVFDQFAHKHTRYGVKDKIWEELYKHKSHNLKEKDEAKIETVMDNINDDSNDDDNDNDNDDEKEKLNEKKQKHDFDIVIKLPTHRSSK
jgi:hypothetical protein